MSCIFFSFSKLLGGTILIRVLKLLDNSLIHTHKCGNCLKLKLKKRLSNFAAEQDTVCLDIFVSLFYC